MDTPPKSGDSGRPETAVICGDCLQMVQPPAESATAQPHAASVPADWYCPYCARSARGSLECPSCGAAICPVCGKLLELADELGIG